MRAFAWRGIVAAVVGGSVMFGSSMVARADDVTHQILNVDASVTAMNLTERRDRLGEVEHQADRRRRQERLQPHWFDDIGGCGELFEPECRNRLT